MLVKYLYVCQSLPRCSAGRPWTHLKRDGVKELVVAVLKEIELDQVAARELLASHRVGAVQTDELARSGEVSAALPEVHGETMGAYGNDGEQLVDCAVLGADGRLERLEREGAAAAVPMVSARVVQARPLLPMNHIRSVPPHNAGHPPSRHCTPVRPPSLHCEARARAHQSNGSRANAPFVALDFAPEAEVCPPSIHSECVMYSCRARRAYAGGGQSSVRLAHAITPRTLSLQMD